MSIYTNQPAEIATSVTVSNTAAIAPDAIYQLNGVQFSGTASLPTALPPNSSATRDLNTFPLVAVRPTNLVHIINQELGVNANQQPVFQPNSYLLPRGGPRSEIQTLNKPLDVLKTPSLPVDKFVRIDFGNARALSYPRISNDYFGYNNLNAGKSILGGNLTFATTGSGPFIPQVPLVGRTYQAYRNPPLRTQAGQDLPDQLPCLSGSVFPVAQGISVAVSGRTLGKPLPSNCKHLSSGVNIQNDLQFNNMSLLDSRSSSTFVGEFSAPYTN